MERLSSRGFVPPWVWHEHLARYAFAAQYVAGKVVVDCACGEGIGTALLCQGGPRVVAAFDCSSAAVATARLRHGGCACFAIADGRCLPVADHTVDVYVAFETLEHVDDDAAWLAEVCRVLTPAGVFICSTPNRAITNPGMTITDRPWNRYHVREYAQQEFVERLRRVFDQIELYGQNPTHPLTVRVWQQLGRFLPGHGAVVMRQAMKAPQWLWDRAHHHAVRPQTPTSAYEYVVALCRAPR